MGTPVILSGVVIFFEKRKGGDLCTLETSLRITKKETVMGGEPRLAGDGVGREPSQVGGRTQTHGQADIHIRLSSPSM